jgi:hypothetical protein
MLSLSPSLSLSISLSLLTADVNHSKPIMLLDAPLCHSCTHHV